MAPTTQLPPPPVTPIEPVTDILHGVAVTDPYRWLESQDSPRTRQWLGDQARYARSYLDAIPGRETVRQRIRQFLAVDTITDAWKVGKRYFFLKRSANEEQPAIMMGEGNSMATLLVNPMKRGLGNGTSLAIVGLSNEARFLAYGIRQSGKDRQSVEFLDVMHRQVVPRCPRLEHDQGIMFSSDERGFYYSKHPIKSAKPENCTVCFHQFGQAANADIEVFWVNGGANTHIGICGSANGRYLAYLVTYEGVPCTREFYLQDLTSEQRPNKLFDCTDSLFVPFFIGNSLYALSDRESPNLRIVMIDLEKNHHDQWKVVVPESHLRIKDFAATENVICVGYVEALSSKIEAFDLTGRWLRTIPCPLQGTAHLLRRPCATDTVFYSFSSFTHPPTVFSYDTVAGKQTEFATTAVNFDPRSTEVNCVHFTSKDGTRIPMSLVRRGRRSSSPLPTLLTAYGGFGTVLTPRFNVYSQFLIERGFLIAVANIRGGGEFGNEWHEAGRRNARQHMVDDFLAAAEWLISEGYTKPEKLSIAGGSNGAMLAGAALTQRPDLFRAVVCVGPLLDMLRYHLFDDAKSWIEEYGTSEVEADFRSMLGYSPYHRVRAPVHYPAVLFVSGDADTRCNPMHARKMTARLQAATVSGLPILLDYRPLWGHVPVQPLTQRIEALTDRLAFICHEVGVC